MKFLKVIIHMKAIEQLTIGSYVSVLHRDMKHAGSLESTTHKTPRATLAS